MLDTLITNKTRMKLLLRFFLNPDSISYLRGLEEEFGESTNAIRVELNRFETAGLLISWNDKNKKLFRANQKHPLFVEIQTILRKHIGIDILIDKVINNIGNIKSAYLNGLLATGMDPPFIDLVIFGHPIDENYMKSMIEKASQYIKRTIRFKIFSAEKENEFLQNNRGALLIWKK
jgi:hypothetical protein